MYEVTGLMPSNGARGRLKHNTAQSLAMYFFNTFRDYFFKKPGAGPTMTAKNPGTCSLSGYMTKLTNSDILLLKVILNWIKNTKCFRLRLYDTV